MEKRQFIQVTRTYQDKNKLNKQLRENLEQFDRLLVDDIHKADCLIRDNYIEITQAYKGTARIPKLQTKEWENEPNRRAYYIDDCISLEVVQIRTLES